jgi:coenzyme PQQ precursor peptide PqqA
MLVHALASVCSSDWSNRLAVSRAFVRSRLDDTRERSMQGQTGITTGARRNRLLSERNRLARGNFSAWPSGRVGIPFAALIAPRRSVAIVLLCGDRSLQRLKELNMQWTTPAYTDLRFGFEITLYVATR